MSQSIPSSVRISIDGKPAGADLLRSLRSLEVEGSVGQKSMFRLKFVMGMEPSGDWMSTAERTFTPMVPIKVDATIDKVSRRLINGYLTQFKMNFQSDPCQSELELVGMDALEKLERNRGGGSFSKMPLRSIVAKVLDRVKIAAPTSGVPDTGAPNPNRGQPAQPQNDLEFLRTLAEENGCDLSVEPKGDTDQGHFEPLRVDRADPIPTPLVVGQDPASCVRNATFYYDLIGPTVVEASMVDAQGKATPGPIRSELRSLLSDKDKALLGPPGFEKVQQLQRHGAETRAELKRRCDAELDKLSWLVIGRGELDTAAYRDLLAPRRRVEVRGASGSFNGTYLVWKVAHQFTRDLHCQKFELRRKLGVR
ncbi:hypothetical protein P12x_000798 [Tundrisphaera lichenicola]|uniref:hypothetical protein n=1 Tax=Tundrisphaera lichenicola TaxID=2029860 RepID=UPI003EBCE7A0